MSCIPLHNISYKVLLVIQIEISKCMQIDIPIIYEEVVLLRRKMHRNFIDIMYLRKGTRQRKDISLSKYGERKQLSIDASMGDLFFMRR